MCDLEVIKKEVPIENEISKHMKLMKTAIGWRAHCPWHDDKVPSFTVYSKTNSFYCYSCGVGGSVIDFLMRIQPLGDWKLNSVIRYLLHTYGQRNTTNTKTNQEKGDDGRTDVGSSQTSITGKDTI
jgi:DNA primase